MIIMCYWKHKYVDDGWYNYVIYGIVDRVFVYEKKCVIADIAISFRDTLGHFPDFFRQTLVNWFLSMIFFISRPFLRPFSKGKVVWK